MSPPSPRTPPRGSGRSALPPRPAPSSSPSSAGALSRLVVLPRTPPRAGAQPPPPTSAALSGDGAPTQSSADHLRFVADDGELVEVVLPPDSDWLVDATDLDKLAPFVRTDAPSTVAQMVLDADLAQRLCGQRRARESSPSVTPQPNRSRVLESGVTKFYVPRHLLLDPPSVASSSAALAVPAEVQASQSSEQGAGPASADYDHWTAEIYDHMPKVEHRARFWQFASEAAKARITKHLQSLAPNKARVVQAREQGWIPSL